MSTTNPDKNKMRITNIGSCCIDHVYSVPHFVKPGETLTSTSYDIHPGGKGLNQSLALAKAGASVHHAGMIGEDGAWLKALLDNAGVDTLSLEVVNAPTGHASIQISPDGENAIVITGGANRQIAPAHIDRWFKHTEPGNYVLIQNEISNLASVFEAAEAYKQRLVFNTAPMSGDVMDLPLDQVELFILNEIEAEAITGEKDPKQILSAMLEIYPKSSTILTLGAAGAIFKNRQDEFHQSAVKAEVIDTTGAGDTFTGFFLAHYIDERPIEECLSVATKAASICVSRSGAATSIPDLSEVIPL